MKFQYLEQNAKDKYVKSIVSDIDDAPIVTAEQNKELSLVNEEKKEKLKAAKNKLADVHNNIRLLAPMVEQGERINLTCKFPSLSNDDRLSTGQSGDRTCCHIVSKDNGGPDLANASKADSSTAAADHSSRR